MSLSLSSLHNFNPNYGTDFEVLSFLSQEDLARVSVANNKYHKYINKNFRIINTLCMRYQNMGFEMAIGESNEQFVDRIGIYLLSRRGRFHKAWKKGTKNQKLVSTIKIVVIASGILYLYQSLNLYISSESVAFDRRKNEYENGLLFQPELFFVNWLKNHKILPLFSQGGESYIYYCNKDLLGLGGEVCDDGLGSIKWCNNGFNFFLGENNYRDQLAQIMACVDQILFTPSEIKEARWFANTSLLYSFLNSAFLITNEYRSQRVSKFIAGSLSIIHNGLCYVPGYSWALGLNKWRRM